MYPRVGIFKICNGKWCSDKFCWDYELEELLIIGKEDFLYVYGEGYWDKIHEDYLLCWKKEEQLKFNFD